MWACFFQEAAKTTSHPHNATSPVPAHSRPGARWLCEGGSGSWFLFPPSSGCLPWALSATETDDRSTGVCAALSSVSHPGLACVTLEGRACPFRLRTVSTPRRSDAGRPAPGVPEHVDELLALTSHLYLPSVPGEGMGPGQREDR